MPAAHATYENVDERPTLRFERRLAHPVDAVWRAITDPSELGHWFPCQVEVELRVGGEMKFEFEDMPLDAPSTMPGRVTDLDPPRLFAFFWGEDHLRFELQPLDEAGGCLLRFTVVLETSDKAARDAAGWHQCLDALERQLSGAPAGRHDEPGEWRERYAEYTRLGLPAEAPVPDPAA
jgi:uncharacterized protein YndB with AHSA1/START domain